MKRTLPLVTALALSLSLLAGAVWTEPVQAQAQKRSADESRIGGKPYYRYRNDKGTLVIDDAIPSSAAQKGYDIITADGRLIERVAPAPTEAELAAHAEQRQQQEEAARVAEWEKSLTTRYRSVTEVEAARDRVLQEYENQLNILRGNLGSQRAQIEIQQQRAADMERQGRTVHASIQKNIQELQKEILASEEAIAVRQQEIDKSRLQFEADIQQFRLIEQRRQPKGGKPAKSDATKQAIQ